MNPIGAAISNVLLIEVIYFHSTNGNEDQNATTQGKTVISIS